MRRALYILQRRTFDHVNKGAWGGGRMSYTPWRTFGQYPTSMEAFNAMEAAPKKGLAQFRIMHRGEKVG